MYIRATSTEINRRVSRSHNNWREVARCHYHGIIVSVSTTGSLIIGVDWWQIGREWDGGGWRWNATVGTRGYRNVASFHGGVVRWQHAWSWRVEKASGECESPVSIRSAAAVVIERPSFREFLATFHDEGENSPWFDTFNQNLSIVIQQKNNSHQ